MLQSLVRKVHFSAAHRYENPQWDEAKNRAVFGSCYSPKGHGHNYTLEAHVSGPVDRETGMIMNLRDLDAIMKKVTDPLDHRHLNQDIPFFKTTIPTTENIAGYLMSELKGELLTFPNVHLLKVVLYESEDLWVEIEESPT